jgi:hypothetical protein
MSRLVRTLLAAYVCQLDRTRVQDVVSSGRSRPALPINAGIQTMSGSPDHADSEYGRGQHCPRPSNASSLAYIPLGGIYGLR